jgi:hypothetical protein
MGPELAWLASDEETHLGSWSSFTALHRTTAPGGSQCAFASLLQRHPLSRRRAAGGNRGDSCPQRTIAATARLLLTALQCPLCGSKY